MITTNIRHGILDGQALRASSAQGCLDRRGRGPAAGWPWNWRSLSRECVAESSR